VEALKRAAERHRARWNALFAQARREAPRLDAGVFAELLRHDLAPACDSLARSEPDPEKQAAAADILFQHALDLIAREQLGPHARVPDFARLWCSMLVCAAHAIAVRPAEMVPALTNALHHLCITPGARPGWWSTQLVALHDPAQVLDGAAVLAWRAGLPRLRTAALAACARLDDATRAAALGDDAPLLSRLHDDPWASAERPQIKIVARLGGFRGFGGPFLRPPRVGALDEALVVTDGETTWKLHADRFGAQLARTAPLDGAMFDPALAHPWGIAPDGTITRTDVDARVALPELQRAPSYACTARTLAVVLPRSHTVALVAHA
jgi:hypothetical protein